LHDLVSYNEKHNEANEEGNADGHSHNLSWNCGVEGPTDDAAVRELRARQKRNLIATLLLSQGVPMLLGGDELGRTQLGNNNAYCQDNEISWVNWKLSAQDEAFLRFVQRMIQLRQDHPVFRRRRFFQGRGIRGGDVKDLLWLTPEGREMTDEEWSRDYARSLAVFFAGDALEEVDARGRPVWDENFLLLLNAHHEAISFALPQLVAGATWDVLLDTAFEQGLARDGSFSPAERYVLGGRALALMMEKLPHHAGRASAAQGEADLASKPALDTPGSGQ
jgi:glycogen operon protein